MKTSLSTLIAVGVLAVSAQSALAAVPGTAFVSGPNFGGLRQTSAYMRITYDSSAPGPLTVYRPFVGASGGATDTYVGCGTLVSKFGNQIPTYKLNPGDICEIAADITPNSAWVSGGFNYDTTVIPTAGKFLRGTLQLRDNADDILTQDFLR
jgi:hypothetical protein